MKDVSLKPMFIIISAYQSNKSEAENRKNHSELLKSVEKLRHKEVQGCYKGIKEDSVYIEIHDVLDFILTWDLMKTYAQESILVVNEKREAKLRAIKTACDIPIGIFTQVTEAEALEHDSWTYDPTNKGWFVCI